MGNRQKAWARKKRLEFMDRLGWLCKLCGCADREQLELDCIIPQGHLHHRMDTSARMSFYKVQLATDNLQVLCKKCNAKKGDDHVNPIEENPF